MSIFDILLRYQDALWAGLLVTLKLATTAWLTGLSIGILVGALAHQSPLLVGAPLRIMAFLLSGIPFLVLMYWAHYPFQEMLHVVIDPFVTSAALLSLINIVAVGEVWRGALNDFRQEYRNAAVVCGFTPLEILRFIQIPLVLRQALPMVLGIQVLILQTTLFTSLISVPELFRVAQEINSTIYRPIEIYSALAILFVFVCVPVYAIALYLRRKYTRDLSER